MIAKAVGKKDGKNLKVEYNDGKFLFDGLENILYESEMKFELGRRHPFGGTYFPDKDSDLNIINVIENYFFDFNTHVDFEDADIDEIESEAGRIY